MEQQVFLLFSSTLAAVRKELIEVLNIRLCFCKIEMDPVFAGGRKKKVHYTGSK